MQLKNLKISFIFKQPIIDKEEYDVNKINFKIGGATFTIYKHSPMLVNVTGIKDMKEVDEYRRIIERKYNQMIAHERIDGMFFSHKDNKKIDLKLIYYWLKETNLDYFVDFNEETFHGMYLKPRDRIYPTIILFRSGTFTLMGGKNFDVIDESEKFVTDLVLNFQY